MRIWPKRSLVAMLFGLALLGAAPASAVAPIRMPGEPFDATFAAGQVCPFALTTETVLDRQTVTTFLDQAGNLTRVQFTGRLVVRLTNDATGKAVTLNASGPGTLTVNPDGSLHAKGEGPSVFFLFPTDSGGPTAFATTGEIVFDISLTGQITVSSVTGRVTDLCALLS